MSEQRLGSEWVGSISSGTMREEHLIPVFEDALDHAGVAYERPEAVDRLMDGAELDDADWDAVSWYVNEELWGLLDDVAPEGTSFGAHEGDGADYGFWAYEDEAEEEPEEEEGTAAGDELIDLADEPSSGAALFESPNLDGLSMDPADYDRAEQVLRQLAGYCNAKAQAMRLRLAGDVNRALAVERYADGLYQQLPQWAKW
jgi:hypothetical protein